MNSIQTIEFLRVHGNGYDVHGGNDRRDCQCDSIRVNGCCGCDHAHHDYDHGPHVSVHVHVEKRKCLPNLPEILESIQQKVDHVLPKKIRKQNY